MGNAGWEPGSGPGRVGQGELVGVKLSSGERGVAGLQGGAKWHRPRRPSESRSGLFVEEVVRALALYEDALPFRRALAASLAK